MININKKAALKYLEEALTECSLKEISDNIYNTCIVGYEASEPNAMTYYCRAFNITAYGVENQYKGILSDFLLEYPPENLRKAFSQIFTRYPKGMTTEAPTFADVLESQLAIDAREAAEEDEDNVLNVFKPFFKPKK